MPIIKSNDKHMSDAEFAALQAELTASSKLALAALDARIARGISPTAVFSPSKGCYVECNSAEEAFIASLPKREEFGNNFIGEGD